MHRILAACLRIATGVAVLILLGLLSLFVAFRRPSGKSLPRLGSGVGAEPARLRGHVAFLCRPATPRDSEHPGNLDAAAAYVAERFSETGSRVSSQRFTARRAEYRNVVSRYGPESGPLWVVGAHYDAFGSTGPMAGADDNASGVAGLLELGRLLGRRPIWELGRLHEAGPATVPTKGLRTEDRGLKWQSPNCDSALPDPAAG